MILNVLLDPELLRVRPKIEASGYGRHSPLACREEIRLVISSRVEVPLEPCE